MYTYSPAARLSMRTVAMTDEIIMGARRRYPNGKIKTAAAPKPLSRPQAATQPTVINVAVHPVANGYFVEVGGKQYVAPTPDAVAKIVAEAIPGASA